MLPDLPKLKKELFNFQKDFIHYAIKQGVGPFKDSKRIPMYEGHRHGVEKPTGDEEIHDFTPIQGEITLKPQEDNLEITFEKLYDMGLQMDNAFQRKALDQLKKSLTEKGQSVNAKGMTKVNAIFEMLEKVEFPLGSDGKLDMSGYKHFGGSHGAMIKAWKEIRTPYTHINVLLS